MISIIKRPNLLDPVLLHPEHFDGLLYLIISDMDLGSGQPPILEVTT
jgi:hypothetical protein